MDKYEIISRNNVMLYNLVGVPTFQIEPPTSNT